jgi:hypothetical protein
MKSLKKLKRKEKALGLVRLTKKKEKENPVQ